MVLKEKVAIVTGGGSGVGRVIALRFAREGAHVVVAGRTLEKVQETASEVEKIGTGSLALKTDVSISTDVSRMVEATINRFGRINILVNNAGTIVRKTFFDYTEEDWDTVMDVNLKGVFLCCQQVVPVMMKQGKGKIINIASTSGHIGHRMCYGASKAGVINFTATLALQLAPYRINVNSISPGIIDTSMAAALKTSPELEAKIVGCIPYGRIGRPEDTASVALFLASDESDYMVGSDVIVDGGLINTFPSY